VQIEGTELTEKVAKGREAIGTSASGPGCVKMLVGLES
jgi:hypothetical protein